MSSDMLFRPISYLLIQLASYIGIGSYGGYSAFGDLDGSGWFRMVRWRFLWDVEGKNKHNANHHPTLRTERGCLPVRFGAHSLPC
jgi:hypothetical protein